jgi:bifunctional non-homologous end joining protein LigD
LHALLGPSRDGVLRYSDHVEGQGDRFFREACRMSLEGVVSKRRDAPYTGGRTRSWLKVKCVQGQEVVIGGFTEPKGRRSGLGALLIGVNEDGRSDMPAKVGRGSRPRRRGSCARVSTRSRRRKAPSPAPAAAAQAHWVRPTLVAEVDFTEWTPEGRLRHPSFKGLREDKPAREIVRERPRRANAAATAGGGSDSLAGVRLTHPERVLYPETGLTKRGLAEFYVGIADWILPHLVGRPTTLVRCPDGLAGECFYQKHTGYWAPASLRRVHIAEKRKTGQYLVVDDLAGLVGLVQIGILEIHTWNATSDRLERPDRLVFDLDPGDGVPWDAVVTAARLVRERLRDHGLESFVKTTGGKGLHVVAPIDPGPELGGACGRFAREVAEALAREAPDAFVATMTKARRHGRIFVDWLRNVRGATASRRTRRARSRTRRCRHRSPGRSSARGRRPSGSRSRRSRDAWARCAPTRGRTTARRGRRSGRPDAQPG